MSDKNVRLQKLRERLAENHYKMTPQRKEILQIFIENENDPHLLRVLEEKRF